MKKAILILFLIIWTVVIGFTSMFPIIISAITGNWWYLFTYFVIWIPMLFEIYAGVLIISLFEYE